MKNYIFKFLPLIMGLILVFAAIFLNCKYNLNYRTIKGFNSVLESMVNFLSIVIGFYSAFYGMIISMQKTKFMQALAESEYSDELPKLLLWSLVSAFMSLILTIFMQVLINYYSLIILVIYFGWCVLVGIFITYAFQTSLLSIAMLFGSEPIKKTKVKM